VGHTSVAWLESADRSGTAAAISAVSDYFAITSGDNLRLVEPYKFVNLAYMISNSGTYYPTSMSLDGASLAIPHRLEKGIGLNMTSPNLVYDFRDNPFSLPTGENLTATGVEVDEAGVAHYLGLVLIVADGKIPKGPTPQLTHIMNATATATTAGSWTDLALTLTDTLPKGTYEMFGARALSASLMAARMNFKEYKERPAIIPNTVENYPSHSFNDFWGKGYRFEYPDNLPTIEVLECTGSGTVTLEAYLRKVA